MRIRTWTIGLFIIIGLGLFTGILFQIGSRQKAFGRHLDLYTEFSNLGGLSNGAKVRVSGIDGGRIKSIGVPRDPNDKFRLEVEIEERLRGIVRTDSLVSIETEGVVGDKFLSIKKGTQQGREVNGGDTLPSKEPFDITALMENSSVLLNDVHGGINDIRGRVDTALDSITRTVDHADRLVSGIGPDIAKITRNGTILTEQLKATMNDLNAGKGAAGLLLKDDAARQQIQASLQNVQNATANLDRVSQRADQTLADVQSRQLVAKMQRTLDNVQSLTQNLDSTLKESLAKDSVGQDGATNLRQTLSNLSRSTSNLAEDTEALKHNFFFRGFFKRRGFYHLDQLSRAEYLAVCDRTTEGGVRKWLDASNLIVHDGNGQETLSDDGRQLIDAQVAPVVDQLANHVVIVEGYATTGSADQQYVQSRKRADLVRHYLETRYSLQHSDLGIVALRDQPPDSAGRARWDGAAIMLLENSGSAKK